MRRKRASEKSQVAQGVLVVGVALRLRFPRRALEDTERLRRQSGARRRSRGAAVGRCQRGARTEEDEAPERRREERIVGMVEVGSPPRLRAGGISAEERAGEAHLPEVLDDCLCYALDRRDTRGSGARAECEVRRDARDAARWRIEACSCASSLVPHGSIARMGSAVCLCLSVIACVGVDAGGGELCPTRGPRRGTRRSVAGAQPLAGSGTHQAWADAMGRQRSERRTSCLAVALAVGGG